MDDTKRSLTGSMSLRLELGDMNCSDAYAQKMVASIIGSTIHARPVYHKRHIVGGGKGFYFVDGWLVYGRKIRSRHFCLCNMEHYARVIEALELAGFPLNGYIRITYLPEKFDAMTIFNLRTILQARHELIKQALEIEDDLRIVVSHELALGVPLGAFSMRKIEACICLLHQACLMAQKTGKVRMKPGKGTNPRYEMRSWLLRLGFIGKAFEGPRRTLLSGLEGDTAFFDERGKEKAMARRKAVRLIYGLISEKGENHEEER